MGSISRKYSGTDPIQGLVVADGLTEGTCVACDASTEPLGVAVDVSPDGLVDIATNGERAFVFANAAIAADASNFVSVSSSGKAATYNPATAESSAYVLGMLVRPHGEAIAKDSLVEVAINIHYHAVAASGGEG